MTVLYSDVSSLIRSTGQVSISVDQFNFTIDLAFSHERAYAAKLLCDIRHPQCDIDELLISRFVRRGDRVLDGGAHIGFTARQMLMAGATEVIAVEPVPSIFARLKNVSANGLIAVNGAIGATRGSATLILSTSHNQGSSLDPAMRELFPHVFGDQPNTLEVEVTTIDCLAQQYGAMDVWKLDIEGAEGAALLGAQSALATASPRVIIAELYDRFRDDFVRLAEPSHPHAYRAYIRRDDYSLQLLGYDSPSTEEFHSTSPMYVFSRVALP